MDEISQYTHSRYLRPDLKFTKYGSFFATGVIGGAVLKDTIDKPAIFWLVLVVIGMIAVYQLNWHD